MLNDRTTLEMECPIRLASTIMPRSNSDNSRCPVMGTQPDSRENTSQLIQVWAVLPMCKCLWQWNFEWWLITKMVMQRQFLHKGVQLSCVTKSRNKIISWYLTYKEYIYIYIYFSVAGVVIKWTSLTAVWLAVQSRTPGNSCTWPTCKRKSPNTTHLQTRCRRINEGILWNCIHWGKECGNFKWWPFSRNM
jgi:hypothetical protein